MGNFGNWMLGAASSLPFVGGIISDIASNVGSKKRMHQAHELNLENWHRQVGRDDFVWERQAAYNDPRAQMERLQAAGLNPHLIYGTSPTSAVGQATPPPKSNIPPVKPAPFKVNNPTAHMSQFADWAVKGVTTDKLQEQTELISMQRAMLGQKIAHEKIKTSRSGLELGIATALERTSIEAAKWQLKNLEARTIGQWIDNYIRDATKADEIKKIALDWQIAEEVLEGKALDNEIKRLEKRLKDNGIWPNAPWWIKTLTILGEKDSGMNSAQFESWKQKEIQRYQRAGKKPPRWLTGSPGEGWDEKSVYGEYGSKVDSARGWKDTGPNWRGYKFKY